MMYEYYWRNCQQIYRIWNIFTDNNGIRLLCNFIKFNYTNEISYQNLNTQWKDQRIDVNQRVIDMIKDKR